jgi:hypothetical protein
MALVQAPKLLVVKQETTSPLVALVNLPSDPSDPDNAAERMARLLCQPPPTQLVHRFNPRSFQRSVTCFYLLDCRIVTCCALSIVLNIASKSGRKRLRMGNLFLILAQQCYQDENDCDRSLAELPSCPLPSILITTRTDKEQS